MGDLDKNVHRKEEPSPYEKIIVHQIEKDKREKPSGYKELTSSTQVQIFSALISYFKKVISVLRGKEEAEFYQPQQVIKSAFRFRALLLLLSKEDRSHNPTLPSSSLRSGTLFSALLPQ